MNQYKTLIIYSISNDQLKKLFENELEKYGLERVGEQGIFALPLEEYRTKVQAFGQPGHGTVRGITHERGTDSDNHAANQSDE